MADSLLESELFGYEQGAFTGAQKRREGKFWMANGGTIFLDEIGTASITLQEKLLRVVEYGAFQRVGGTDTLEVDVRVIAASNVDPRKMAAEGKFRKDLLDRLCFDVIQPPPLRERGEDILELATYFANRMAVQLNRSAPVVFSHKACSQLLSYRWPGNIRELKNAVERSVFHQVEDIIEEFIIDPFKKSPRETKVAEKEDAYQLTYDSQQSLPENIKRLEGSPGKGSCRKSVSSNPGGKAIGNYLSSNATLPKKVEATSQGRESCSG